MKTHVFSFAALVSMLFTLFISAQPLNNPQKDLVLEIKSNDGNNGIAVTYNPEKDLYYVAFGGNKDYPLEVFTSTGKNVYTKEIGFDSRGIAYDKKTNSLYGNAYDDGGYYKIPLNDAGLPTGQIENIMTGMHQPNAQSGGFFDMKKKLIYFRNGTTIYIYKFKTGLVSKEIELSGISSREVENCVEYIILYTGKKGYEFILVNYLSPKIYFFNKKGEYVTNISLNYEDYMHDFFNLSYANDRLWIYSKDYRRWTGYKLF
ncbi:MAG: hypothetical protein C0592_03700 [Marinilabiliales bacterium]|nr:MAG: hypothetical protein C0592_03700 [Marinilabiliales bacterium]